MGETNNIWTRNSSSFVPFCPQFCVAGEYLGGATIKQTGGAQLLVLDHRRPQAEGSINKMKGGYAIGYMDFPDDRIYVLNFRVADNKIYWDGLMGETNNIWT